MKKKNNKTNVLRTYVFVAVLAVFIAVSVFLTVEAVASGSEVTSINEESAALLAKQKELNEVLVKGISVTGLEEKSTEMGFVKPSNVIYINDNESVAVR